MVLGRGAFQGLGGVLFYLQLGDLHIRKFFIDNGEEVRINSCLFFNREMALFCNPEDNYWNSNGI
jgi:hypothetical protein